MDKNNLHNYQNFAIDHIISNPFCGLFLDMGLGKTVSTLTAIDILMYEELEINHALVVAPKRVVETVWKDEAIKWEHLHRLKIVNVIGNQNERIDALKTKADIHVISRDNFAWLVDLYADKKFPFDMLILDELSSFKSYKSQRFKAGKKVRPLFKRVIGLTGTPVPNGLLDLWAQMYLIDKGERLEKTITNYRNTYFRPGRSNGQIVFTYELLPGSAKIIYNKIEDICISMKALDHIKMPERIDNFIEVVLPPETLAQYNEFEKNCVLGLVSEDSEYEITALNKATLGNKLLQFANGAVYDEYRTVHKIHDYKIDALLELIEDLNGQPVIIAWSYQHDRDRLKDALIKYKPRELKTEQDIRDWNDGKIQILLTHPASGGHGLNLQTGGSVIIWFSMNWSLELYQQLNSRLFRQGQQSKYVVINHLVVKDTHDEDVVAAIRAKDRGQEKLLAAVKARIQKYISDYGTEKHPNGVIDFPVYEEDNK